MVIKLYKRLVSLLGTTSSSKILLCHGKTNPDKLRMIIKTNPINTNLRLGQIMVLKACTMVTLFLILDFGLSSLR